MAEDEILFVTGTVPLQLGLLQRCLPLWWKQERASSCFHVCASKSAGKCQPHDVDLKPLRGRNSRGISTLSFILWYSF
jgi:hypothetical protein